MILWSGFWWKSANQIQSTVEEWFANDSFKEDRDFDQLSVSGYPSRLDITIVNPQITNKVTRTSITASVIQLLTLIYSDDLLIVTTKLPIEFSLNNTKFAVTGVPLKTSIRRNNENTFAELITESSSFILENDKGYRKKIEDFLLAFKPIQADGRSKYQVHFSAKLLDRNNPLSSGVSKQTPEARVATEITFSGLFVPNVNKSKNFLDKGIAAISDIDISIANPPIDMSMTGDFELSSEGNLYGSLKLEIKSWEALLTQLVENGMIESDKLSTIRAGLIFIASQAEANAKSITIPLFLKKNTLYLGPLKIANLSYPVELYNREFNHSRY